MFGIEEKLSEIGNSLRNNTWSDKNLWNEGVDWFFQPKDGDLQSLQFHVYGMESINLSADITDNYVESNISYQDHIALKPRVYTVSGEVGELTWFKNDSENSVLGSVAQKLQPIATFLPTFSKTAQKLQDKAIKVLNVVDSIDNFAKRTIDSFTTAETQQQKNYWWLMWLWSNRTPLNIKTPWLKLYDFVIQNVEFTQPERTVDKTQVKVTLKEFRQTKRKTTAFDKKNYQERAFAQNAEKKVASATSGIKMTDFKPNQFIP